MTPTRMSWLDKIFRQVEADWKANRITYADALQRLCEIGWSLEQATRWLAKN